MEKSLKISPYMIRYCPIASLDELSSGFAVSSVNKSNSTYHIFISCFSKGRPIHSAPVFIAKNYPNKVLYLNSTEILAKLGRTAQNLENYKQVVFLVHSVPEEYLNDVNVAAGFSTVIDVPLSIIHKHGYGPDTFVEYWNQTGDPFMAVGYHGLLWNMKNSPSAPSTLIQGAKCFSNFSHTNCLMIMNVSAEFTYRIPANIGLRYTSASGQVLGHFLGEVPPFEYCLIKLQVDDPNYNNNFFNILGSSTNATLLPFVVVVENELKSGFIEHGVVPSDYAQGFNASAKLDAALHLYSRTKSLRGN